MKNILVTVAVLMLGWGLKFGWNLILAEPAEEATAAAWAEWAEWAADEDAWVEESLRDGSAEPARGWLDAAGHSSFEGHPAAMNDLIERLHEAGAENVWMVGIEQFGGNKVSDTLAAELPTAAADRERVFAVTTALFGEDGASEDFGQRYLMLSFD